MYLKRVLKGQLTRTDDLFSEVHYLRWALYAWTGISAEGGTNHDPSGDSSHWT